MPLICESCGANYANVSGLNIANGVATPLSTAAAPHITVQADVSATDLVADVLGYYNQTSCQAGTVKALGQCYETALRADAGFFAASDVCKAAGGRLATPLELRSLRGGNPLTLSTAGEWTEAVSQDVGGDHSLTVFDNGGILIRNDVPLPFRCVFRPLP